MQQRTLCLMMQNVMWTARQLCSRSRYYFTGVFCPPVYVYKWI